LYASLALGEGGRRFVIRFAAQGLPPATMPRRRHSPAPQTHNTLESQGGNVLGTCVTGANLVDSARG